jgi:DNA (cytosine-5)-methyltransferase 1
MASTYYNEFDKQKCSMLSQLMKDGHITKGDIDDRSIRDVQPDELKGYTRAHFFAGIGLWDHALNLAGWEEDRPVWTGSCPCQPFSAAGGQKGKDDDRHLWPEWLRLIEKCRPPEIFGEQVANAITKGWLDDVYQGLEAEGYAVGSVVLPASAVGAPHRRERLWIVANTERDGQLTREGERGTGSAEGQQQTGKNNTIHTEGTSEPCSMANTECIVRGAINGPEQSERVTGGESVGDSGTVGDTGGQGLQGHGRSEQELCEKRREIEKRHAWEAGVWLDCPDGKQRLVEPRISLLVNGDTERVGLIHAAGDAIVPQVAEEIIRAAMYVRNN